MDRLWLGDGGRIGCTTNVFLFGRLRRQQEIAPHEVEQKAQRRKRNQREQIGVRAIEEWIVRCRPCRESLVGRRQIRQAGHDGDNDARQRAPRDVAGGEQHAGTFVALRHKLIMGQTVRAEFMFAQPAIDQPAKHSANENRSRGSERQIHADGKGERRNAAHLESDGNHHA